MLSNQTFTKFQFVYFVQNNALFIILCLRSSRPRNYKVQLMLSLCVLTFSFCYGVGMVV